MQIRSPENQRIQDQKAGVNVDGLTESLHYTTLFDIFLESRVDLILE